MIHDEWHVNSAGETVAYPDADGTKLAREKPAEKKPFDLHAAIRRINELLSSRKAK